ncbi:transglycosylase SLT domain-containing protein [Roseomonas sp. BN140053]|uniref:transglycosylase SLT domain-containing protein n=1 Tax=Roseomonas sp. BN140053 TaxID=3391898 RepID=UPI0039EB1B2C
MATVSQVTEAAFVARFDDAISAGANAATAAMAKLASATEAVEERVTRSERSARSWVGQNDLVTQAANRAAKAERDLTSARKALADDLAAGGDKAAAATRALGALSEKAATAQSRYAALRSAGSDVTKGMEEQSAAVVKATNAFGLAGYQIRNLTAQAVDFAVQVGSGGGLFTPLLQQGPQAVDALGGVSKAISILGQVLTPTRLLAAGFAASLLLAVTAGESQERAMAALSTRLKATRADYAALTQSIESNARALAGSTGLSTADAREAGAILGGVSTYSGTQQDLRRLQTVAGDVAAMMGVTVPQAAEKMAAGLRRPGEAARQLAAQDLRTLDERTLRSIESLDNLGRRAEASALLMDALSRAAGNARDAQTPFQRALSDLDAAVTRVWNGIRPLIAGIGTELVNGIAAAVDGIARLIGQIDSLGRAFGESAIGRFLLSTDSGPAALLNGLGRVQANVASSNSGPLVNTASAAEIRARVEYDAAQHNVPRDFALAVAGQESNFRQIDSSGRTLTSSAGALGTMQIMPATAAALGIDANDAAQNIAGGIRLLAQLLERYGGDQSLAAAAYNAGPRRVDNYMAGRGSLPQETWDYIRRVAPDRTQNGQVVASGGVLASRAETLGIADERARAANVVSDQTRKISEQIAQTRAALAVPNLDLDSQERLNGLLRQQLASYEALKSPEQRRREQFQDYVDVMTLAEGASRTLRQAELEEARAAQAEGRSPNLTQARADAQTKLNLALSETVAHLNRDTDAQQARNEAGLRGIAAQRDAEIATKAQAEAVNYAERTGANYTATVAQLTQAYKDQQAQAGAASLVGSVQDMEAANKQLQLETSLISASTAERERALAVAQAQRQIDKAGADGTDVADRMRAAAAAGADLRSENRQLTNSWNALANIGEQAFDRIGDAITQAFANGSLKAIDFRNVAKAVLSEIIQQALRLAAINPFLNATFGGDRATLGGIATVAGGEQGGVAGGGSGAAGNAQQASTAYSAYNRLSGMNPGDYISGAKSFNTGIGFADSFLNTPIAGYSAVSGIGASSAAANGFGYAGGATASQAGVAAVPGGLSNAGTAASAGATGGLTYGAAAAGALGIAGGAYGVYSGLQRGGPGGYTSAAGGAATAGLSAAALAGMAVPVYGWIAAAVLTIIGALLPGQKPSNREGNSWVDLNGGENGATQFVAGGATGKKLSEENRAQAAAASKAFSDFADQLGTKLGGMNIGGQFSVGFGDRDGIYAKFGTEKKEFEVKDGDEKAAYEEMAKYVMQRIVGLAREQATGDYKAILDRSGDDLNELQKNLDFYEGAYKQLSKTAEEAASTTTQFAQALDATRAPYAAAIEEASRLGLSIDKLADRQSEAVTKLLDQRLDAIIGIQNTDRDRVLAAGGASSTTIALQYRSEAVTADIKNLTEQLRQMGLSADESAETIAKRQGALDAETAAMQRQLSMARVTNDNGLWDRIQQASGFGDQPDQMAWAYERKAALEWQQAQVDGITDLTLLSRAQAEERLQIERDANARLLQAARDAAAQQISATSSRYSLVDRLQNALYGSDDPAVQLEQFDRRAALERWQAANDGAADLVLLEETLAAERLVVAKQGGAQLAAEQKAQQDRAAQAVTGVISSLADYAQSLQTSDASPLSARDQYDLTVGQFNAVSGAAMAGDYNSLSKLQGYSESFLAASRAVNGSGAAYAADFQRVVSALGEVGKVSPDTLTASFMATETRAQTDTLNTTLTDGFTKLVDRIAKLEAVLMQAGNRPVRNVA